jgi:phage shock protein A
MNILNKIIDAIKEGTKELSEAIIGSEDTPEFVKEIEESKKGLKQAKHELTEIMAKEIRATRKLEAIKAEISENETIVEHALKQNDEKLAMKIADQVAKLERQKNIQVETLEAYTQQVNGLKKTMERAERQLKEYERQINMVETTESVQKATKAITDKLNSNNSGISSAKDKLEKIKQRQNK